MAEKMPFISLLDCLIDNEEAIGKLYDEFAKRFPEKRGFWNKIADEERIHARWIRTVRKRVAEGTASFNPKRFSIEEVQRSLAYVTVLIQQARQAITWKIAVALACQIEQSMLEKKIFEIRTDDSECQIVWKRLAQATALHIEQIEQLQSSESSGSGQPAQ